MIRPTPPPRTPRDVEAAYDTWLDAEIDRELGRDDDDDDDEGDDGVPVAWALLAAPLCVVVWCSIGAALAAVGA